MFVCRYVKVSNANDDYRNCFIGQIESEIIASLCTVLCTVRLAKTSF